MGIVKSKDLRTGFTITFWELIKIDVDIVKGFVRAVVAGYKNEEMYQKDKNSHVELYPFEYPVDIDLLKEINIYEYSFEVLQRSRKENVVLDPAVFDEKTNEILKEAVVEEVEQNFFFDAIKNDVVR